MDGVRRKLQEKIDRYTTWRHQGLNGPVHTELKHQIGIPYLRAALERLDAGFYGVCVDCEEQIPNQRLEAVPGAIRCTGCQNTFENKPRRTSA